jgi:hypothetical protein
MEKSKVQAVSILVVVTLSTTMTQPRRESLLDQDYRLEVQETVVDTTVSEALGRLSGEVVGEPRWMGQEDVHDR